MGAGTCSGGSLGGLLLHHHNDRGARAEAFVLPGAATADVGVTIGVSPASPNYGDSVTLTITATNAGPDPSSPLVAITLPAGLTYVSDDGAGALDAAGLWTGGSRAASGSASVQIVATLDSTEPAPVWCDSCRSSFMAAQSGCTDTDYYMSVLVMRAPAPHAGRH